MAHVLVEVCVDTIDDALAAVEAGADRLELNAALSLAGLTPSAGFVAEVRRQVGPDYPLVAMLRPREGGFCYSPAELEVMRRDVPVLLEHGASGIACGILTAEGHIDRVACETIYAAVLASPKASEGIVFHRAFDFVPDPLAALETLIELGVRRVLTSGLAANALAGIETIAQLITAAKGRIEILPGGGIGPGNVLEIVKRGKVGQIHGSFREACSASGEILADYSLGKEVDPVLGTQFAALRPMRMNGARIAAAVELLRTLRV